MTKGHYRRKKEREGYFSLFSSSYKRNKCYDKFRNIRHKQENKDKIFIKGVGCLSKCRTDYKGTFLGKNQYERNANFKTMVERFFNPKDKPFNHLLFNWVKK